MEEVNVSGRPLNLICIVAISLSCLLVSCRAGVPRADGGGSAGFASSDGRVGAGLARAHAASAALAADESRPGIAQLVRDLAYTEAGLVLLRGIEAHGGLERWLRLEAVSFERHREIYGRQLPEVGVALEPDDGVETKNATFSFDPRQPISRAREDEWLFSVPFNLFATGDRLEYLGVEQDVRLGLGYEKLKLNRALPPAVEGTSRASGTEQFVLYFDAETSVLRQILLPQAGGRWILVRFLGWTTTAGLRVPTRRESYRLASPFRRVNDENLLWKDEVSAVVLR